MPGCFTIADTLEELAPNIVEAMQCWFLTTADMERRRHRAPRIREAALA